MVRTLAWSWLVLSLSACGEAYPTGHRGGGEAGTAGDAGSGGGGGAPAVDDAEVVIVGAPVDLLAGDLTSHALAPLGSDVVAVATRREPAAVVPAVVWTRLAPGGEVAPEARVECRICEDEDYGGEDLSVGAVAVAEPLVFLAMSTSASLISQHISVSGGGPQGGGGASFGEPPPRPFRPSAVPFRPGFLVFYNAWGAIGADHDAPGDSTSFGGFHAGFDPHVVLAGGVPWLGWNTAAEGQVAPLAGAEPPLPHDAVGLGPAAHGPVLAAGPDAVLALTWGDALEAHLVTLDPPAVAATATVAIGPISGRPAAVPWAGGFLVLWADATGTAVRGRVLDALGRPLAPPDGFVVIEPDRPVLLEPVHAVGDADLAWLSWRSSAGLHAVPLSRQVE